MTRQQATQKLKNTQKDLVELLEHPTPDALQRIITHQLRMSGILEMLLKDGFD